MCVYVQRFGVMASDYRGLSERNFYLRAIARYGAWRAGRVVLRRPALVRTQEAVIDEYEQIGRDFLARFEASAWGAQEYALRERNEDVRGFHVAYIEDGVITDDAESVSRRNLSALRDAVARHAPRSILEVGSGTGRNILWLLEEGVGERGRGLELTAAGVEVGNLAAKRFGLAASFEQFDVYGDWSGLDPADVVFSMHALEQIPQAGPMVAEMVRLARRAVVMIEPFPDYWRGLARIACRLRNPSTDRLNAGALKGFDTEGELLPFGTALNRASLVTITI
jgi:SAM-dependent methyltransferase